MKYSTRLSDAVHIMVLVAIGIPDSSSAGIAKSIATNPAFVRRIMSELRKGGLLLTSKGKAAPALARDPGEITLLDVYRVAEKGKPLLHLDTHTNPECHDGIYIQHSLQESYEFLQEKMEEEMAQISLQDVIDGYYRLLEAHGHPDDTIEK